MCWVQNNNWSTAASPILMDRGRNLHYINNNIDVLVLAFTNNNKNYKTTKSTANLAIILSNMPGNTARRRENERANSTGDTNGPNS